MKRTAVGWGMMAAAVIFAGFTASTLAGEATTGANASADWPQWRGPNRDGTVVGGPKLLDCWPKDGPPLLWKSGWIPACNEGGVSSPVVADGRVFVYAAAKDPVGGAKPYQIVTTEILEDAGWLPDLPDELAKKIEAAWASKDRPASGWEWYDPAKAKKDGALDGLLAKKPELDKYIKDFIGTLGPDDAKKYGGYVKKRLCIDTPKRKWGVPNGLSWEQLAKLSQLRDTAFGGIRIWERELQKRGIDPSLFTNYPVPYGWNRAYTWSDTIVCLDAATGKELWRKVFPVDLSVLKDPGGIQWWSFDTLGVSSTPAVASGKVYVAGALGLYCLSAKDGALLWQAKGEPEHASPLVAGGVVYHVGVAYDAETGSVRWKNPFWDGKHKRLEWTARYSSPLLFAAGGRNYLVTTDYRDESNSSYVCLDVETGRHLWSVRSPISTLPLMGGEMLIAVPGYGGSGTKAYRVTPSGVELLWRQMVGGGAGHVYRDHVYLPGGFYSCLDLRTGLINWKQALRGGVAECSTTVLADGKIFTPLGECHQFTKGFGDLTYSLSMIRATPDEYVELGTFNPHMCMMTSPAIVAGRLYLRLLDGVACYDLQEHGVYVDAVDVTREKLTFRFKQTGGGLVAKDATKGLMITDAAGAARPAPATINGDDVVVDIKDVAVPFTVSYAGGDGLVAKNGLAVPAFAWKEPRLLTHRKSFENTVMLASDAPLQQDGRWSNPEAFSVAGAKVTSVKLDPAGKSVSLITDRTWKPGDAVSVTYASFPVNQGEPRREKLSATVAAVQRAAATFLRADEATNGTWKGIYGSEGAVIAGDTGTAGAPTCGSVRPMHKQDNTPWAFTVDNPMAPQLPGDSNRRSNRLWYSQELLDIAVEFTDGKEHQVALYFPLGCGSITVETCDADTDEVLDNQSFPDKGKERYLLWNVTGQVAMHVICNKLDEGHAIWLGGVMIDPAAQVKGPATRPVVTTVSASSAALPGDWPQWRGQNRDGRVARLPKSMPPLKLLWREKVAGPCDAGIAAAGGLLVMPDHDEKNDYYCCLRIADGKQAWKREFPNGRKMEYSAAPRATPLLDRGRVYVLSAFGELYCLDLRNGNTVWQKDFVKDLGAEKVPTWGYSSSPLLAQGQLVVNPGGQAALVALDPQDGKVLWKGPGEGANYSSFIVASFGGVDQVVGYDAETLGGWELASGARLWTVKVNPGDGYIVPTPVAVGGRLLVADSRNEARLFAFEQSGAARRTPVAKSGELAPEIVTPVAAGDLVLGQSGGRLVGLAAENLRTLWTDEKETSFEAHCHLIVSGDRALAMNNQGELLLLRFGRQGVEVLGKKKICEKTRMHPTIAGDRLLVRDKEFLYCYDLSEE